MAELDQAERERQSRLLAATAYFFAAFGGLFLLLYRREDRFVRFHALQAVLATVAFSLAGFLLWVMGNLPLLGFLYSYLLRLYLVLLFAYWLFLIHRAWKGDRHHIPYLGRFVDREFD